MINNTPARLIFIRTCILLLQYAPLIEAALLSLTTSLLLFHGPSSGSPYLILTTVILSLLLTGEGLYFILFYRPHKAHLLQEASYPTPPPTRAERAALFDRCIANVSDWDRYLRLWFLDADTADIKRENIRDFLLWAFFDHDPHAQKRSTNRESLARGRYSDGESSDSGAVDEEQLDAFIAKLESTIGHRFAPGRGKALALRLTFDSVDTRYRSVLWYGIIAFLDLVTHLILTKAHGFTDYRPIATASQHVSKTRARAVGNSTAVRSDSDNKKLHPSVFPPRLQHFIAHPLSSLGLQQHHHTRTSPSTELSYFYRPHRSRTHLPILFLHGIGIGLWPYVQFLAEINKSVPEDEQIGILALELLPLSSRLVSSPLLTPATFLAHLKDILSSHHDPDAEAWLSRGFILVSHSYGSVLTTHILRSHDMSPLVRGVVLIDPVTLLLHLPDVCYNFTRRAPRGANEWQLWYFASMDLGVARGLGRHFFWRENIIWPEELTGVQTQTGVGVGMRMIRSRSKDLHLVQGAREGSGEGDVASPEEEGLLAGEGRYADDLEREASSVSMRLGNRGSNHESTWDGEIGGPSQQGQQSHREQGKQRRAAVCLSGKDLIVDSLTVAQYLCGDKDLGAMRDSGHLQLNEDLRVHGRHLTPSGIELLWFPELDHSQVFEAAPDRKRIVDVVRRFCLESNELSR